MLFGNQTFLQHIILIMMCQSQFHVHFMQIQQKLSENTDEMFKSTRYNLTVRQPLVYVFFFLNVSMCLVNASGYFIGENIPLLILIHLRLKPEKQQNNLLLQICSNSATGSVRSALQGLNIQYLQFLSACHQILLGYSLEQHQRHIYMRCKITAFNL